MQKLLATAIAAAVSGTTPISDDTAGPSLARILSAIRTHLGMDVAFIAEIVGGQRVFRYVDGHEPSGLVRLGESAPVEESYCQRVLDGRLPPLLTDACLNAEALTLAATRALPVGAHLSVPIRLQDGRLYGTFCCFSLRPDDSLNERDLAMMRVLAEMAAAQIQAEQQERDAVQQIERRLDAVLGADGLRMVYQPICDVQGGRVLGFESLARFASEPYRAPDVWFSEVAQLGRQIELESRAIRLALMALDDLPSEVYVAVNASPDTIVKGDFSRLLAGQPLQRVVVEITEHRAVERYDEIAAVLRPLQREGLRIAIDDAGAGYSSFRHILNLQPEIVKLDISITRAIDTDRSRRALAAALCSFAEQTGSSIVAEGIETQGELDTLKALGISRAQGYRLGRPMPLQQAQALLH
ncbi:EAL domain-containing protein [Paucibacter sp. APW11]|uniref:EAL domain-containing protein n=1 Tax=Roseateles aquae TaxID=3077235 RepID=A0ABU3PFD9_9BURK|nr:EAL domain-containing protein [Paucibacter sp. APW11]MDT9001085.1 EAL domain-containing protein [Paucibacter sp. APW11]